jgi:hypothetical protein
MKAQLLKICAIIFVAASLSSCATVFGGRVSDCQRTIPAKGEPRREVRSAALILDVLFFPPGVAIDLATGAIFKPCTSKPSPTPETK